MTNILDGKKIAGKIEQKIKEAVSHLKHRPPGLAFVLVGNNPASRIFIQMKKKKCLEVGILSFDREYSDDIAEELLIAEINELNRNPAVDGILVQLPLPASISTQKIMEAIDPSKDVDGFHPLNVGKMLIGESDGFFPCTPHGVLVLLSHYGISTDGKHVVIVGRSNIVGKPLAALLMQKREMGNATVTVAHSHTKDLAHICKSADILIAAMGKPHMIKKEMVKEGAIVVDVGINREKDGIVGDVDFKNVESSCSFITPVPGGVGPMTIAMLLSNTLLSYQRRLHV